jgi:hypothetical protein
VVQLARSQPWLMQAPGPHQFQNPFVLRFYPFATMLPLVVMRLPANRLLAASPRHAQPFDELLRDDLPAGFCTAHTPSLFFKTSMTASKNWDFSRFSLNWTSSPLIRYAGVTN